MVRDGVGAIGSIWHYAMLIALMGSTFLVFVYLWRKGRLDMDEEAKFQVLKPDGSEEEHE